MQYPGYKKKNLSLRPQRQKVQGHQILPPGRQRRLSLCNHNSIKPDNTIRTMIKMLVGLSLNVHVLLWLYDSNIYSIFSVCESCCSARLVYLQCKAPFYSKHHRVTHSKKKQVGQTETQ